MTGFDTALIFIGCGILAFLAWGGPQACFKIVTEGKVKVAEANARVQEAKLEQMKLDRERELQ